jgi:transposase-like protein
MARKISCYACSSYNVQDAGQDVYGNQLYECLECGDLFIDNGYCHDGDHKWKQEYYGVRCSICGMFYPDGCAPWEDETI